MGIIRHIRETNRRYRIRTATDGVPLQEEIEQFGATAENVIYGLLREEFDTVIRNAIIPHKGNLYLEKDFLVICRGVPVVIEVKNWKGKIGYNASTGNFYQDKPNGVHKELKSPVGTTAQFIRCLKDFYGLERTVLGMVVFAEPDCSPELPAEMEGIHLVTAAKMISAIKAAVRPYVKEKGALRPDRILRCTRIYSSESEFCKGLLANKCFRCYTKGGDEVLLNTDYIRYVAVFPQALRMRDKIHVTFVNGAVETYYNRDTVLSFCCMDGSCKQIAMNKVRYIQF